MLAYVIEDATLVKRPREGTTTIHVRFKGGQAETLTTLNPKSSAAKVKTPPHIVELVDRLLDDHIYGEIATILNERGLRPGGSARPGQENAHFTEKRVAFVVHTYRLRSRFDRLRARGLLTRKSCPLDRIHLATLSSWVKHGIIKAHVQWPRPALRKPAAPPREAVQSVEQTRRPSRGDASVGAARSTHSSRTGRGVVCSQLLVPKHRPRAIPREDLNGLSPLAEEDEQRRLGPRLATHPLANEAAEPLEAEPHVHRLDRHEDLHALGDHVARSVASAATTERSNSTSKPRSTWRRAGPISMTSTRAGAGSSRRRNSSDGVRTEPSRASHLASVVLEMPRSKANRVALRPLRRKDATSSRRSAAVWCLGMSRVSHARARGAGWGPARRLRFSRSWVSSMASTTVTLSCSRVRTIRATARGRS